MSTTKYDVFISYTMEDKQIATAACEALEAKGIACWIAPRDVDTSEDWGAAIILGIEQSRTMLVVFSSNSNASAQIKREVNQAVELNLPVFVFRIENVEPARALAYYLDVVHWFDAFDSAPQSYLPRLVAEIEGHLKSPDPDVVPLPPGPRGRQTLYRFPKWWLWVAAGSLMVVLVVIVWRLSNSNGPILTDVKPSPSPTPVVATQDGGTSTLITPSPSVSPSVTATATTTPTPTPSPNSAPSSAQTIIDKAAADLGNPNTNDIAAMGIINSLAGPARQSLENQRRIVQILTAYIKTQAVFREGGTNRQADKPPGDIQAAINIFAKLQWKYAQGEPGLDLTGVDLRGIKFQAANFDGVRLVNAHLEFADLDHASFRCANVSGAYAKGISAIQTDFAGTDLNTLREKNPWELNTKLQSKDAPKCR